MLYHHTLRAVPGTRLFRDWAEARALWDTLLRMAPGPTALCLMSNHVHALYGRDHTDALRYAMRGFAKHRNGRRGEVGSVWLPIASPGRFDSAVKKRRQEKYVHLNPWVMVPDPLAWPFSTHLDAVGLSIWPVRAQARDPVAYHKHITSDDRVRPGGTELPWVDHGERVPTVQDVAAAVSHLTRTPLPQLQRRGPARTLCVQAARVLTAVTAREVGDHLALTTRAVRYVDDADPRLVRRIERVVFDPRFPGLQPADPVLAWRPRSGPR